MRSVSLIIFIGLLMPVAAYSGKVSLVCSIIATGFIANPTALVNWQSFAAGGIGLPAGFGFDIDLGKKKVSTPTPNGEAGSGPFDFTIVGEAYIVSSVKDPSIAKSKKTYAIDRRTGVYLMQDFGSAPGIFLETGVCATVKPKF